jgi:excisionase family DNA binding protein
MREAADAQAPPRSNALMTAAQVAERWQVPVSQIYRLAREGRLPSVAVGRYRRFRVESVEHFEMEGGADA